MKVRIFSKRFLMPFSDFRPQYGSPNFQLSACTSHTRFGKPSSSFNVIYPQRQQTDAIFTNWATLA